MIFLIPFQTILPVLVIYFLTSWDVSKEMAEENKLRDELKLKSHDNNSNSLVLLNTSKNSSIYNSIFDEYLKAKLKYVSLQGMYKFLLKYFILFTLL